MLESPEQGRSADSIEQITWFGSFPRSNPMYWLNGTEWTVSLIATTNHQRARSTTNYNILTVPFQKNGTVRFGGNGTVFEEVQICRGVTQSCVLSPTLFNVYSEKIFHEALEGQKGINVNGKPIHKIK